MNYIDIHYKPNQNEPCLCGRHQVLSSQKLSEVTCLRCLRKHRLGKAWEKGQKLQMKSNQAFQLQRIEMLNKFNSEVFL